MAMNIMAALNRKQELAAKVSTDDTAMVYAFIMDLMQIDMTAPTAETAKTLATFEIGGVTHTISSDDMCFTIDNIIGLEYYEAELVILEMLAINYINAKFNHLIEISLAAIAA